MEEIKLDALLRQEVGTRKIKKIRRHDFVPAVIYGEEEDTSIVKVDRRTYERIMRAHSGQNVVFHLNVFDGDKKIADCPVIVREEQHDPATDKILHVDFKRISLTEEIEVSVQINAKGEAIGVKQDGGALDHALWELDIICLPTNIPEKIDININDLKIGDAIHVKDLNLPAGVRTEHDPEAIVVSIVPPMKEISEEEQEEEAPTEPEVIKEKKDKEKEEEPEEPASEE